MARSIWKGPFSKITVRRDFQNKIWSRSSVILPTYLGKQFQIYNGKIFIPVKISEDMIGHKFGEFASTRKKPIHKKKKK